MELARGGLGFIARRTVRFRFQRRFEGGNGLEEREVRARLLRGLLRARRRMRAVGG
jgi:hypothetical protein